MECLVIGNKICGCPVTERPILRVVHYNMNFASCQQNKIPNPNHNQNNHFSGHQTPPVLPLQHQNFHQILSQTLGLKLSVCAAVEDAIFSGSFA